MKKITLMMECGDYVGYGAVIHEDTVDIEKAFADAKKSLVRKYGEEALYSYSLEDLYEEMDEMGIVFDIIDDVDEIDV